MGKNKLLMVSLIAFLLVAATAWLFKRKADKYQPVIIPQSSASIKISETFLTPAEEQQILAESEKIVQG